MKKFCSMILATVITGVSLCFGMAHAAPVAAATAKIQLIAFAYNGAERDMMITDEKGVAVTEKPLRLPTNQCSPVIEVSNRNLVFTFVAGEKATGVGKPITLSLPVTGKDFVLVFLPQPADQGGSYRVHAVELPAERFKSGSYAFLNYTNTEIACSLDKQNVVVAPSKAGILEPGSAEDVVRTACFEKCGDKWSERPFFSGRLPVQRGVRNLVLISRDSHNGHIEFRGVTDFVER